MERIRQAVERAKGITSAATQPQEQSQQFLPDAVATGVNWGKEVTLSGVQLESKRIISHDIADPRSKSFDILRTQVLQAMDLKPAQFLGITSPTPGCGKSLIAINLALSICRQPDRSVLLVDMDLRKPQVANYFGLNCNAGLISVLEGRTKLPNAVVQAHINNQRLFVLPCESATLSSSEWLASRPMSAVMRDIRQNFKGYTVILDLPPILPSDDVMMILPQIDCVLFVAGVGISTVSEIKECNKHLDSTSVLRVILNKSSDTQATHYYY